MRVRRGRAKSTIHHSTRSRSECVVIPDTHTSCLLVTDGVIECVIVEKHSKRTRSKWRKLSEDDILRHASKGVSLRIHRCIHKNFSCFFERAPHEWARVNTVDAMSRDRHEKPSKSHCIAQDSKVTIVHIRTVKRNHSSNLVQQRRSHRLDAERVKHLYNVIRHRARVVNILVRHHR